MPNASYTNRYPQAGETKQRMINLLQENKEMESHRTNSTFVFLPNHKQTLKNQKSYFLPTLIERFNNKD